MNTKDPDVQLVTKLPKSLREAFVKTCAQQDTNASREIRRFIREYIKKNGQTELDI